jgi:cell division protein FtsB
MRIFKYLVGIWIAVAVYSIFSFLAGPRGISTYNQLLSERDRQQINLKELNNINDELEKTNNNLLHDHETFLIHARQLGYGQENEQYVRIVGLGEMKNSPILTGKMYFIKTPDFISDKYIKITALCAGLVIFAFFLIIDLINFRN